MYQGCNCGRKVSISASSKLARSRQIHKHDEASGPANATRQRCHSGGSGVAVALSVVVRATEVLILSCKSAFM